jgi:acyl carrier protein
MDDREVQETLTAILVGELTVDPGRAVGLAPETAPPTEVGGGLGLDSLDVRELSLRIKSRGGPMIEDREARAPLLQSFGSPTWGPDGVARRRVA